MFEFYRGEILKVHSKTKLQHIEFKHAGEGPHQESLITDYFFTAEKKQKCLVHISGVHGVEGYLGSLIQRHLLQSELIQNQLADLPFQIVFVHAVNPFGMAWKRRGNANNVDLNRNSLRTYRIDNPLFKNFVPLFQSGKLRDLPLALKPFLTAGFQAAIEAAACGQTENPNSLFYAGHELQPELISLEKTLKGIISPDSEISVLDIHTGLGRLGNESLIVDGFDPKEKVFEQIFHKELSWPGMAPGIYQSQGALSALFKKTWKTKHCFQEFGTYPFYRVLKTLIHQDPEQMLKTFFPDQESWRKRCIDLGLLRYQQLVQNLS
jgi:hypothetical protein